MYCFHFIIKKIHGIYNNQERFCDLKTKSHWLWWIRMNPCSFFSKSPFFLWTIALCNKRLILILSISDQDDFHPWLRKESNISPFPSQESTETCTDLPGILRLLTANNEEADKHNYPSLQPLTGCSSFPSPHSQIAFSDLVPLPFDSFLLFQIHFLGNQILSQSFKILPLDMQPSNIVFNPSRSSELCCSLLRA